VAASAAASAAAAAATGALGGALTPTASPGAKIRSVACLLRSRSSGVSCVCSSMALTAASSRSSSMKGSSATASHSARLPASGEG